MSTAENSGKEPEQQTPPMAEAGGEDKIDRSVLGTVAATGLAEWLQEIEAELIQHNKMAIEMNMRLHRLVIQKRRLRSILDANSASSAGETISTS
jgi:hypothetical protein